MADGAVALATEEGPLVAVAQERVSRSRYDGRFQEAVRYVLDRAGVSARELRAVAACGFARPNTVPEGHVPKDVAAVVRAELGPVPVEWAPSHHEVHAIAAASQCSFSHALITVADGEGSTIGSERTDPFWRAALERTSYWELSDDELTLIERDHDGPAEVGFGKAYSKVTRYIGFASYQEAGKTMGLAPFGDSRSFRELRLFSTGVDGRPFTTLRNTHDGLADLATWFENQGQPLPPPRQDGESVRQIDADLACWIQLELEDAILERVRGLMARKHLPALCGVGGVFLNSVLNGRMERDLSVEALFIPPSPGDPGLALGAAAWWFWREYGVRPTWPNAVWLGGSFAEAEIEKSLRRYNQRVTAPADPCDTASEALARGRIVAWYQGASEYGPRALGNRSILADPRAAWTRSVVNHLVKGREWFRPLAPALRARHSRNYYDVSEPSPFMMSVASATRRAVKDAPACLHVDGTARLQTLEEGTNDMFERVLDGFERRTGTPILLNTSFNAAGEPIVERPDDAIRTFLRVPRIDDLFVGPFHLQR